MQFRETFLTNQGKALLSRAAASNGRIIWGKALMTVNDLNKITQEQIAALTSLSGAVVADGSVTSSLADVESKTCSLLCELHNGNTSGAARCFGVWARIDGDSSDVLTIVGRTAGATAAFVNINSQGACRFYLNIAVAISDQQLSSVSVSIEGYARASALALTNQAVEELQRSRWRVYEDLWDAFEKSHNGEHFSVKSEGLAQRLTHFKQVPAAGYSLNVKDILGPYALCEFYGSSSHGRLHFVYISRLRDIGTPILMISESGNIDHQQYRLLDYDESDGEPTFLYSKQGLARWSDESDIDLPAPAGKWCRTNAGLFYSVMQENKLNLYEYKNKIFETLYQDLKGSNDTSCTEAHCILLYGKRILALAYTQIGSISSAWLYDIDGGLPILELGSPVPFGALENALFAFDTSGRHYVLNGNIFGKLLAFDCSTQEVLFDFDKIDNDGQAYFFWRDRSKKPNLGERDINPNNIRCLGADPRGQLGLRDGESQSIQPIGLRCSTDKDSGDILVKFWAGAYHHMVNRNGFILPCLDNPPNYPDSSDPWDALR